MGNEERKGEREGGGTKVKDRERARESERGFQSAANCSIKSKKLIFRMEWVDRPE